MKYILVILFAFLYCENPHKEMKSTTNLIVNYEGDIDKPLPKIIFCKNCNDNYDFRVYQFKMDDDFFNSINALLWSNKYSKERDNTTILSVVINKDEKIFLHRKESKLFIEELIELSHNYKDKDVIYEQLFKYLAPINK